MLAYHTFANEGPNSRYVLQYSVLMQLQSLVYDGTAAVRRWIVQIGFISLQLTFSTMI